MNSVCDRPEGLLPLEEAQKRLLESLSPTQKSLGIPVDQALGRILSETLLTPLDFPPFANSAMDGYAVRAADALPGAHLRKIGTILAGAAPSQGVGPGECIRILPELRSPRERTPSWCRSS